MLCLHLRNSSNIMENIFNSTSIYSWKKIFLFTKIKNKCAVMKISIFLKSWEIATFEYDHRFVFSREMENMRTCRKVRLQKLNKFRLSGWYSFWDFLTCLKKKNHLGRRNFSSPFLQNIKFCSYEVLFQLHFKTTRYFDGHV